MRMHTKLRSESGASAVEFALLLPVLMLILFGIIEFGFALYKQAVLTNASREGARLGIVQSVPPITLAAVQATIDSYLLAGGINPGDLSPAPVITGVPGSVTGIPVVVTLTLPYARFTSFIPPITLSAKTEMRHE